MESYSYILRLFSHNEEECNLSYLQILKLHQDPHISLHHYLSLYLHFPKNKTIHRNVKQ